MSTTFDVYPRTAAFPTFEALLRRSTQELHGFLSSLGLTARPEVHVRLQRKDDDAHVPFTVGDSLRWDDDTYAWFMVGDIGGGTDAYFESNAAEIRECWEGELDGPRCNGLGPLIRDCLDVGHRWSFRRSAGQSATINLAYGLIAGSLAAITGGFLDSIDSAWERMPTRPEEFLSYYFRPELTLQAERQDWCRRCIRCLAEEL